MRVVVIGNDAGAVRSALELSRSQRADVTLLCDDEYFVSRPPLVYSMLSTTGDIEPKSLRSLLKDHTRITVVKDPVKGIDTERRLVRGKLRDYTYDRIIISRHLPLAHKVAMATADALLQTLQQQLHEGRITDTDIVIIGDDSVAVEVAMHLQHYCQRLYGSSSAKARISLVTSGSEILPDLSAQCRTLVMSQMKKHGVTVRGHARIATAKDGYVRIDGRKIPTSQVLLLESDQPDDLYSSHPIIFSLNEHRRVQVSPHLEAYDHIYVIGEAGQIPTGAMPLRALDMADYVVDRIVGSGVSLPYSAPTSMLTVPLHEKWVYVEFFGIYVTGTVGVWINKMIVHLLQVKLRS